MEFVQFIKDHFSWLYRPVTHFIVKCKYSMDALRLNKLSNNPNSPSRVFYLGITTHSNLGDMAQHYCITQWINENYPNYELVMFESYTVVVANEFFLKLLKRVYRPNDIIVFQSGYTTTDLGGNHELMHRLIVDNMPYAKILMMPQTIFFRNQENKSRCSESLDKAQHMLFLARDFISEQIAKQMFPHQHVMAFPDIVTTLIGSSQFNNKREGICLCIRNDEEKYYSKEELNSLKRRLDVMEPVTVTDTTIKDSYKKIRKNLKSYIEGEIERYSRYKVVITDRYHGTIFAIAAGTPVVILKTTDHKVTTGADWFNGVYDDYVKVSVDLNDAYNIVTDYLKEERNHKMTPYFKHNYYDKLKMIFEETVLK